MYKVNILHVSIVISYYNGYMNTNIPDISYVLDDCICLLGLVVTDSINITSKCYTGQV